MGVLEDYAQEESARPIHRRGGLHRSTGGSLECAKINFARFALEHLGSPLGPECDAPAQAALARQRLDASVVGLVEDLDASLCLWEYQFGHHRANADGLRPALRLPRRRALHRLAAARAAVDPGQRIPQHGGSLKHAGKYARRWYSLRAVLRIEAALRPHARLYDYAAGLFRRRADAVARATGVRLLCDDDDAATGYSGAKHKIRRRQGQRGGGEIIAQGNRFSWARAIERTATVSRRHALEAGPGRRVALGARIGAAEPRALRILAGGAELVAAARADRRSRGCHGESDE